MSDFNLPYGRLVSLREHLPDAERIEQKYAAEFNAILRELEDKSGADLTTCRVPPSELIRTQIGQEPIFNDDGDRISYRAIYSPAPTCERNYLLMKIDSVLRFFSNREKHIGFKPS